jgi:ribonuclease HI
MKKIDAFFDGATFVTNPSSLLGVGTHIHINGKLHRECHAPINEIGTNNSAEYLAVLDILNYLEGEENSEITLYGDSNLVIKQLSGQWNIKDGVYAKYAYEAIKKVSRLSNKNKLEFKWISRNDNVRADELSKMALKVDKKIEKINE